MVYLTAPNRRSFYIKKEKYLKQNKTVYLQENILKDAYCIMLQVLIMQIAE